ncbi:MAG: GGDEF domain-containing protein, partial [Rhodospirillales bacterium]
AEMVRTSIGQLGDSANGELAASLNAAVAVYEQESRDHTARLRQILLVMLAVLMMTLIGEALFLFRPLFVRIQRQQQELQDLARTDPLTGCHNRRSFLMLAEHEFQQIRRSGREACLMMIDIDRFKTVNDTHGHATGDDVIRRMAETCLQSLRSADIFGRLGGEEFCAVLPNTDATDGWIAAEKLRVALASTAVDLPDGGKLNFTVSIGLALLTSSSGSIHQVMELADANLYHAKNTGRNRVAGPEEAQHDHKTD